MNRPYVIVNAAMSADGKIALPNRRQLRISSEEDMKRVFQLRNSCDGILIGIGAVLADDPKLTVKKKFVKNPKNPVRIVLDTFGKTPVDALVVNDWAPTILFVSKKTKIQQSYGDHVEIIHCPESDPGFLDESFVLSSLYDHGIRTILVEGGGTVIWRFLKKKLVDDLFLYIGSMIIGGKKTPTFADGSGVMNADEVLELKLMDMKQLGSGVLLHYKLL